VQAFFIPASRELRRLESSARSPIFALFSETLDGLQTIRAFNAGQRFMARNSELLDKNQRSTFLSLSCSSWLSARTQGLGAVIVFGTTLSAVTFHAVMDQGTYYAGMAGLAITFALQTTQWLDWLIQVISALEVQMVSVERMDEYANLKTEAAYHIAGVQPLKNWPQQGKIEFKAVDMRYREGLPLVLRGVSFTVRAGEHIGVVGRTGAGKSSIVLALMRLVEPSAGSVVIDGIKIGKIGLYDLRSAVSVIPQDPVLFSGSLRFNLDPFNMYSDQQVWSALDQVQLRSSFDDLEAGVDEGGANLSVGERQLIGIARVILKSSQVVIMDEATANIDVSTDALIQTTMRKYFANSTTIVIAHRINTILNSDRILVMDAGEVGEFETPQELLKRPESLFAQLVSAYRSK
jgi:ABC-type multidrug transport system fused ATPase/permease subunit